MPEAVRHPVAGMNLFLWIRFISCIIFKDENHRADTRDKDTI